MYHILEGDGIPMPEMGAPYYWPKEQFEHWKRLQEAHGMVEKDVNVRIDFWDAVSEGISTCSADCEACGRLHFNDEDEDRERHRKEMIEKPDRYVNHGDESIALGNLNGVQVVWGCPCKTVERAEEWIWSKRQIILGYLRHRIKKNLQRANDDMQKLDQVPDEVPVGRWNRIKMDDKKGE